MVPGDDDRGRQVRAGVLSRIPKRFHRSPPVLMSSAKGIQVDARPEPLTFDPTSAAVIVVDMQNDFAASGGMFDRAGIPVDAIQAIVDPTRQVLQASRAAGILVVYLKMQFAADLSDARPVQRPQPSQACATRPRGGNDYARWPRGRILVEDRWNTEIVAALTPQPRDRVVPKHRYSGFFETELDSILQESEVETLIFTGATTSVCVESTYETPSIVTTTAGCSATASPNRLVGNSRRRTTTPRCSLSRLSSGGWASPDR